MLRCVVRLPASLACRSRYHLTNICRFSYINCYGVTFNHLVPVNNPNPEVLPISFIRTKSDGGAFANKYLLFSVDPTEYAERKSSLYQGVVKSRVARKIEGE